MFRLQRYEKISEPPNDSDIFCFSNGLKLVSLCLQPFDGAGQGGAEFVDAFQRVVEGDDGAVAGIAADIVIDVVGGEPLGIVAGDEVPHDDSVALREPVVDAVAHPTVGRTEEGHSSLRLLPTEGGFPFDEQLTFVGVDEVGDGPVLETAEVVVGVVADSMALLHDLAEELGMLLDVVSHDEKCGLHAVSGERIEQEGRGLGNGSVVEGQIDRLFRRIHSPRGLWIEPSQPFRGLLDNHLAPQFTNFILTFALQGLHRNYNAS